MLKAGVCFPRGNTGLPFFSHNSSLLPQIFLDTKSSKWYNNIKSIDLRKHNRIRGNFICMFAIEQEHNQNDLSDEVCFWLFLFVPKNYKGGHIYVKRKHSR